ncbi:histidine phosphatase family protein [Candidatus Sumerlaeota bacterium]|nr:histidine phosphatase family protein [Candidatus Sumerlaeota bacterium]
MELYIFRHAQAVERDEAGGLRDFDRELTDVGRKQARLAGAALNRLGVKFDTILSSPAPRALQTAKIAAKEMNLEDRVRECPALWEGDFEDIFEACRGMENKIVCLVGHEPTLGDLTGFLTSGSREVCVPLKKAGIARIDIDGLPPEHPRGLLRWVMTGKQLSLISQKK